MCFNWFKKKEKDGNGNTPVAKGVVVMAWDMDKNRIRTDLAPQVVRYCYDNGCSYYEAKEWIRTFRREGIRVVLNLIHKQDVLRTGELVKPFVEHFGNDIDYSIANEPNSNIAPKGEPNTYIDPKVYAQALHNFHFTVTTMSPNAKISCGDFNGGVNKNKTGQCMITEQYIDELVKYDCLQLFNEWSFHTYEINTQFYNVLNCMRKHAKGRPISVTEFPGRTKEEYAFYMNKFKLNGIGTGILYAWQGGKDFQVYDKPELLAYIKGY